MINWVDKVHWPPYRNYKTNVSGFSPVPFAPIKALTLTMSALEILHINLQTQLNHSMLHVLSSKYRCDQFIYALYKFHNHL